MSDGTHTAPILVIATCSYSRSKRVKKYCLRARLAIVLFHFLERGLHNRWETGKMHLPQSCLLLGVVAVAFLVPKCYASPAAFASKQNSNIFDITRSSSSVESPGSSGTNLRRSIIESPSPRVLRQIEDNRSRSLMPLPTRDISLLKLALRIVWDHFLLFATSDRAIVVMTAVFSEIQAEIVKTGSIQTAKQALSITYGALKFSFRSTGVIAWTLIEDFLQSMTKKVKAGLIGFFEVHMTGPNGVMAFVALVATVFSRVDHGPAAVGGQNPNLPVPRVPNWVG